MSIPASVDELTPEWFTEILAARVDQVEVLDAHSGTTGRARIGLTGASDLPDTVFVKLQPFVEEQRKFLRQIGLGVAEARLYAAVGNELPVRAPRVWHADHDAADGAFVMVLEDLEASGCRFLRPTDDDILDVAASAMDELATLHAAYRHRDLAWLRTPSGMKSKPEDAETAARRAQFIVSALDQFADDMPPAFRRIGELYATRSLDIIALFNEGDRTLIHGDTHSGNLFVDAGRTGFYDWAVAGRAPGVRDVAYFLCNSLPVATRRSEERTLWTVTSPSSPNAVSRWMDTRPTSSTGCSRCTRGSPPRRPPRWAPGGNRSRCRASRWSARRPPNHRSRCGGSARGATH